MNMNIVAHSLKSFANSTVRHACNYRLQVRGVVGLIPVQLHPYTTALPHIAGRFFTAKYSYMQNTFITNNAGLYQ
jgi:hypothetical protein